MKTSFEPVARASVGDAVHEQLRAAILQGQLAAGDALPGERALAEQFGVNRHAIREAVKRLAQVGLVDVAHGGATRVQDWRQTAGLDVLPDLAFGDGRLPDLDVVRATMEMRESIGVDVVRKAAQRRSDEQAATLLEIAGGLTGAARDPDRYADLWNALVDASQNVAYRLALNSLLVGTGEMRVLFEQLTATEITDRDRHVALAQAIRDQRAEDAAAVAQDLLRRAVDALGKLTGRETTPW